MKLLGQKQQAAGLATAAETPSGEKVPIPASNQWGLRFNFLGQ